MMDAERMRAAIGPRAERYLARFEKIEQRGGWAPGWNWAAFFFSTAWFTYRRMDGWASANFFFLVAGAIVAAAMQSEVVFLLLLVAVFVLLPLYADAIYFRNLASRLARSDAAKSESKAAKLRRPPSAWSMLSAILSQALAFFLSSVFLILPTAYADYGQRARVSEGISLAAAVRRDIDAFYAERRRLPGPQEAAQFRSAAPMKYTESVIYDAARRMVVVTMREDYGDGRQLAMRAAEKDGALAWRCLSIDVAQKYLPASCRD